MTMDLVFQMNAALMQYGHLFVSKNHGNRRTGGTGLGLSITSDIVLSHGGELTLGELPLADFAS